MNYTKPANLKEYFWDVQWQKFDPKAYPVFVVERILEYGNEDAIQWLKKNFSHKTITTTLKQSRKLSKKSANYWGLFYGVKPSTIKCLNTPFQSKQKTAWNA